MDSKDYYQILDVSHNADADEIKSAYRKLAIKYHPDHNPNNPQAEVEFKKINEAYQVLSRPSKRARYDRQYVRYEQQRAQYEQERARRDQPSQPYKQPEYAQREGGSGASGSFRWGQWAAASRRATGVSEKEAMDFVLQELKKFGDRNDLISAVCEMTGMEWFQAEQFIQQAEAKYARPIAVRSSSLVLIWGIPMVIGALIAEISLLSLTSLGTSVLCVGMMLLIFTGMVVREVWKAIKVLYLEGK